MSILLGILLAAAFLWVVTRPFLRRLREPISPGPDPLQELSLQRETIYEEISTLELERELGTIGEEEYQARLRSARLRAAANLREQEQLGEELQRLSEELEVEVQQLRAARGRSVP